MRVRVFSRGSNPAIDPPLQRKSLSYAAGEVEAGRADWVDPGDPAQGILCRAFLYSGQTLVNAAPEAIEKLTRARRCPIPALEVGNTRFDDPEKRLAKRKERRHLVITARTIAFFGAPLEVVQLDPA